MFRNEKTASGAIRNSFVNQVNQNGRKTDLFHFRVNGRYSQCKKCFQPATKLSFDGLCLSCEQLGEYVWREVLTPTQRAQFLQGANV